MEILFAFLGAIVGGVFSYYGNRHATKISIKAQEQFISEAKELETIKNEQELIKYSKIIYLDILNAIDEAFTVIKNRTTNNTDIAPRLSSTFSNYSEAISLFSNKLDSDELLMLNRLFGVIEKIRWDILHSHYQANSISHITSYYKILLIDAFGEKELEEIIKYERENITRDYFSERFVNRLKETMNSLREISGLKRHGN